MSYGQGNENNSNLLLPGMAVAALLCGAIYLFVLKVPAVRAVSLAVFTLLKVIGCVLTFHFSAAGRLLHLARFLMTSPRSPYGVPEWGRAYKVVMAVAPPSWLIGLVITSVAIIPFICIKMNSRGISEQKIVASQQEKTLKDVIEDWQIPAGHLDVKEPLELAANFAKIRKDRNIPPSIFSRKIEDPMLSKALLHFERVLKRGEVFEKIVDPDKLAEIIKTTMPGVVRKHDE